MENKKENYSKEIQEEMFKRHTHAELVNDKESIVYEEKDVLILMRMLCKETGKLVGT